MILLSRLASDELMKRIWQSTDSCGLEIRLRGHFLVSYRFASKRRIQSWSKWILAEDADGKGAGLGGRDFGGPFDESAKVVEVGSFRPDTH